MVVVVVMGICGSGKTTIGNSLSTELNWPFEDADDWHSKENITKMSQNIPLTDEDRQPWLESLHRIVDKWAKEGKNGIVGCSALKRTYRDILIGDTGYKPSGHCVLVYLEGSIDAIAERMKARKHFMPVSLLQSQISALELPMPDETSIVCSVQQTVPNIVSSIVLQLQQFL